MPALEVSILRCSAACWRPGLRYLPRREPVPYTRATDFLKPTCLAMLVDSYQNSSLLTFIVSENRPVRSGALYLLLLRLRAIFYQSVCSKCVGDSHTLRSVYGQHGATHSYKNLHTVNGNPSVLWGVIWRSCNPLEVPHCSWIWKKSSAFSMWVQRVLVAVHVLSLSAVQSLGPCLRLASVRCVFCRPLPLRTGCRESHNLHILCFIC